MIEIKSIEEYNNNKYIIVVSKNNISYEYTIYSPNIEVAKQRAIFKINKEVLDV